MKAFARDMTDPALEAKVARDQADGLAAGVEGTPTFFLNRTMIGYTLTYDQLNGRIDAALR